MNEKLNISLQVPFMKDLSDLYTDLRLWSSLKKFYGRHHELVNGYRASVTQIRTDLLLLLMSFPSSDGTSTGLDHGQRSGFATSIDPSEAYDQISDCCHK